MQNKLRWHIIKEGIFLLIVASLFFLVVFPVKDFISISYLKYFGISIFIIVQYFRVVVNERNVIWVRPFFMRILFGIGNVILFIYIMDSFAIVVGQFEDYNFTGVGVVTDDLRPGMSHKLYSYLRSATYYIGISAMILIILFEFRLVYSIFKYRDIPGRK